MSFNYSPKIVTNGLVLCLDAANTKSYISGSTTWNDLSREGNNGTLTNGPTFNTGSLGSIVFDGTDDYVDCGNNSSLNLTNNFSLSVWVRPSSTQPSVDGGIIGRLTETDAYAGYLLFYDRGTRIISLYIRSASRASTNALTLDTNYYIVGTYNGSTASIYVNGVLVNSNATSVLAIPTGVNFHIGKYTFSGNPRNFAGNIFSTQVYNRALTSQEVLQNYNATKGRFGL